MTKSTEEEQQEIARIAAGHDAKEFEEDPRNYDWPEPLTAAEQAEADRLTKIEK